MKEKERQRAAPMLPYSTSGSSHNNPYHCIISTDIITPLLSCRRYNHHWYLVALFLTVTTAVTITTGLCDIHITFYIYCVLFCSAFYYGKGTHSNEILRRNWKPCFTPIFSIFMCASILKNWVNLRISYFARDTKERAVCIVLLLLLLSM